MTDRIRYKSIVLDNSHYLKYIHKRLEYICLKVSITFKDFNIYII